MPDRNPSDRTAGRPERPIERGFPIERVNEIVEKESRGKRWYRPIYTMHNWWARRSGCLFRAIALYSLLDADTTVDEVAVFEPGTGEALDDHGTTEAALVEAVDAVSMDDPEPLWEFYAKDVRLADEKILDPFAGGGTSLVEASRFGVDADGVDLNPVAWFVTKKQLEAGRVDVETLEAAYDRVEADVADDVLEYYRTPCPNGDHEADAMYYFWVKELDCLSCEETVPLFKDYRIARERYVDDPGSHVLCPDCRSVTVVDDWRSESECGECGYEWVPEDGHVTRGGYYNCPACGRKDAITDAIAAQGRPDERLYAVEYYCAVCDERGLEKSAHKGYKGAETADRRRYEDAGREWRDRTDLHEYVPQGDVPEGATTVVRDGVAYDGHDLFTHGYETWTDLFNERQLLSLATLLRSIDGVDSTDARDYLLLAFSDSLMFQSTFSIYNRRRNNVEGIFRLNGYAPQGDFVENNVWGTAFGRGTFRNTWEKLLSGVRYAREPTDRYVEDGEMVESPAFAKPIGSNASVRQGDMRALDAEGEYDAVITDPPYYDNVIYSELSDYFYVWQTLLLEGEYPGFDRERTPREASIVTNPFLEKTADDFEHEMGDALAVINRALKEDGVLVFTYHHSDEESWGELLAALCGAGFDVTATYPINSDLNKFIEARAAVSFDIVIVARPTDDREPIPWNTLRRRIYRTASRTHTALAENRELKRGDVGVVEMGKCFQEYAGHHGEVRRAGDVMSAKAVVEEIYGIVQNGTLGEEDVYLELLEEPDPSYSDLTEHLDRSDASEEAMREMELIRTDGDGLVLGDWDDEQRQAYVRARVEATGDPTTLDKAHFLRYRYERDRPRAAFLDRWDEDELRELCEDLVFVTGDETYLELLGVDRSPLEFDDGSARERR